MTNTQNPADDGIVTASNVIVPAYLEKYYWWAYARPWAIKFWERDWLIDLILWFHYKRLRGEALAAFGDALDGKTLQMSCAYGALTPMLHKKITASGGSLDVVDVVIHQLRNLKRKIPNADNLRLFNMDATAMSLLPDQTYDRVLMFFLPHELPKEAKEKAFNEAFRVAKPGGTILVVEFSKPKWWHPLRYIYLPFLRFLEPFAPQIWKNDDIGAWVPKPFVDKLVSRKKIFGDYYQILMFKA
ncbi:MAG: rhodoquinone biosynthesis methyltransferase RquA [Alphaproteobacteria bacterium]|nr:rhodoquinone biosynthesis methyltransferase RquA [Alphaproteobacteria bacterium]